MVGRSLTPKAIVKDIIINSAAGPELSLLLNFRKRLKYVKA
jgi:hypothetical protein